MSCGLDPADRTILSGLLDYGLGHWKFGVCGWGGWDWSATESSGHGDWQQEGERGPTQPQLPSIHVTYFNRHGPTSLAVSLAAACPVLELELSVQRKMCWLWQLWLQHGAFGTSCSTCLGSEPELLPSLLLHALGWILPLRSPVVQIHLGELDTPLTNRQAIYLQYWDELDQKSSSQNIR